MLSHEWKELLGREGLALLEKAMTGAEARYAAGVVYPPRQQVLAAFATAPQELRAVILGQDPYHEPGQAHGFAFSVPEGTKHPPSLRNIFTELETDLGIDRPQSGDLTAWAKQGVLLLNTALTVDAGKAGSHGDLGWQDFTDHVVKCLAQLPQPMAFVLWGAHAGKKVPMARASVHPRLVLTAPHPSPLSSYRGFFGSRPFSKINGFLAENGENSIDWRL